MSNSPTALAGSATKPGRWTRCSIPQALRLGAGSPRARALRRRSPAAIRRAGRRRRGPARGRFLTLRSPASVPTHSSPLLLDQPRQRVALRRLGDRPRCRCRWGSAAPGCAAGAQVSSAIRSSVRDGTTSAALRPERDAAIELRLRLEPAGLVLVEAVLVVDQRRQLVDVGEQRVRHAPRPSRPSCRCRRGRSRAIAAASRLSRPGQRLAGERRETSGQATCALRGRSARRAERRSGSPETIACSALAPEGVDQAHAAQFLAAGVEGRMEVEDARRLVRSCDLAPAARRSPRCAAGSSSVGAWPMRGTVHRLEPGSSRAIALERRGREDVRQLAAHAAAPGGRRARGTPATCRPARRLRRRVERLGDLHVVVERDAPAGADRPSAAWPSRSQSAIAKSGIGHAALLAQPARGVHPGREAAPLPDIVADPREPRGLDLGPDVVEHRAGDPLGRRSSPAAWSSMPAERGADRDDPLEPRLVEQRERRRRRTAAACSSPDPWHSRCRPRPRRSGADHPPFAGERARRPARSRGSCGSGRGCTAAAAGRLAGPG